MRLILLRRCFPTAGLLERVSFARFLHSSEDILVDAEADGDSEDSQGEVGHHGQHGEERQGQKQHQQAAKHHPSLLQIPPVDQVQHCTNHMNTHYSQ